jgi:hypothetical protein
MVLKNRPNTVVIIERIFQQNDRDRLVPEVQIVRGGDEGVDEGEAGHAQRLVVPDEEALHYRLESIPALHLAGNCDRLQGLGQMWQI